MRSEIMFKVREVMNDVVRPFRFNQDEITTRPHRVPEPPPSSYAVPKPRLPDDQEYEITLAKEIFVELSQIPPDARNRVMGIVNNLMDTYEPTERDITPHTHPQGAPI
jgi:hypothetical protein